MNELIKEAWLGEVGELYLDTKQIHLLINPLTDKEGFLNLIEKIFKERTKNLELPRDEKHMKKATTFRLLAIRYLTEYEKEITTLQTPPAQPIVDHPYYPISTPYLPYSPAQNPTYPYYPTYPGYPIVWCTTNSQQINS